MNALLPQFSDFVSVVREFAIKCRLCGVSASCRCNGGGHAHIQGRTASGDSSGGENISRPGLRSGELSGFRLIALQETCRRPKRERKQSVLAWLRLCCRFLSVPAEGPRRSLSIDTVHRLPRVCCRVFFARLECRAATGHFPRTRPGGRALCGRPACGTGVTTSPFDAVNSCKHRIDQQESLPKSRRNCAHFLASFDAAPPLVSGGPAGNLCHIPREQMVIRIPGGRQFLLFSEILPLPWLHSTKP